MDVNHPDPFESCSTKNRAFREEPRRQFPPSRPASPLSTGFPTFDRLPHDNSDVRKRVPMLANFRARERKVDRSYIKLKWCPKPWYPPSGIFVFSQKVENLAVGTTMWRTPCATDRYAIGPVGQLQLSTRPTNTGAQWIPQTNVL